MSSEGKAILESLLGQLFGFDDGVADILEHLLSIDSKEDFSEYLSQLLGSETPEILHFVENVGRYKRGEQVILKSESAQQESDSKPATKETKKSSMPTNQQTSNKKNQKNKKSALQARRNQKQNGNSRVPPPSKKSMPPAASKNANHKNNAAAEAASKPSNKDDTSMNPPPELAQVVEKSRPTRGKATIVCGCMGTKHKALTNCLYCGRISCVEEGYDFCPFCGLMIEEIKDGVNGNDASWVQKERLLRFDREFARRTQIFDDQADFQSPATWMTEEEMQQAEENQHNRLEALKRPKQTLSISLN